MHVSLRLERSTALMLFACVDQYSLSMNELLGLGPLVVNVRPMELL